MSSVLFVCVKNGGKSQMAAGLMRKAAGESIEVHSAGTRPGSAVNALSAQSLLELGVDISGERPTSIDPLLPARVDFVVVLGSEARVHPVGGPEFLTVEPPEKTIITGANKIDASRPSSHTGRS